MRQPHTLCPLCRTPVDQTVLISTLNALLPQTESDDDDDDVFLPRYEDGLLSDNSSDDSSDDSDWSGDYNDLDLSDDSNADDSNGEYDSDDYID